MYTYQVFKNMREWLSGRALPCQGKCREFESRLPLQYPSLAFVYIRHLQNGVPQKCTSILGERKNQIIVLSFDLSKLAKPFEFLSGREFESRLPLHFF